MEKLTGSEILKILNEKLSLEDYGNEDFDIEELGLGEIKIVDSGGGMDEGSHAYRVDHFIDHDVYIKIDGYYQSHYGYDWEDEPYEVEPYEVPVTKYRKK